MSSRPETWPYPRKEHHERERKLDADRIASMADEGGRAGARMELREQLRAQQERRRVATNRALIWGAVGLASGVAAVLLIPRLYASRG